MKQKKTNWFVRMIIILFVIFMGLFIAGESGYYEAKLSRSVALTSDSIKQFEEDVLNGKEVDITSYIKTDERNYENGWTLAGEKVSRAMEEFFSGGISNVWDVIKVLFYGS